MAIRIVGLCFLFACTGPVSCYEYCHTGYLDYSYCTNYCCVSSPSYYDYCCISKSSYYDSYTSSVSFSYWIIAPIVIGAIVVIGSGVAIIMCCCVTVNGKTRVQAFSSRRVGTTSIEMTSSVNQQQSTMNRLPYPQQYHQANPMYPQPYPMDHQPYGMVPQFGVLQDPMQSGGSQTSVPPPYSSEQGKQYAINLPKY
ncbi:uncharacterized protein LOC127839252 [Dreissena polymorpha]|uniref:Uncharacterized protein n=1 Tax=Dreissena polymorpha TaxID=45954 RepID=A0A9D4FIQ5_DREPO|nr:uncharacterized protein LOC127839252 [Dreissena polymorpha]KAH3797426.1 hypothetical protein DPMN_151007 [Dreissena polymorpha]